MLPPKVFDTQIKLFHIAETQIPPKIFGGYLETKLLFFHIIPSFIILFGLEPLVKLFDFLFLVFG